MSTILIAGLETTSGHKDECHFSLSRVSPLNSGDECMGNNGMSTGLKAAWDMMHLTGPHERHFFLFLILNLLFTWTFFKVKCLTSDLPSSVNRTNSF